MRSAASPIEFKADNDLPAEAWRLLKAASEPGTEIILRSDAVDATASVNGITIGRGSFALSSAATLCVRGLARLERRSGRRVLALTSTGTELLMGAGGIDGIGRFRAQHIETGQAVIDGPAGRTTVMRNICESPLDWLARRQGAGKTPLIDQPSFQAGDRLRADMDAAQMSPRMGVDWSPAAGISRSGGPAGLLVSERVTAARQRVQQALRAVGPDLSGLLVDLCGFSKGLELIESERRWPKRSAKIVVRIALAALARHYGYSAEASGTGKSRGIESWNDSGNLPDQARRS